VLQARCQPGRAGLYRAQRTMTDDHDAPDAADELEVRDQLLLACRELLLTIGTSNAVALVAHINATLDLDDGYAAEAPPEE
jgi:hypothetical protein